jgi:hypothetical protein
MAAINAKYDLLYNVINRATAAMDQLKEAEATITNIGTIMEDVDTVKTSAVKKQGKELKDKIKAMREAMTGKEDVQGIYREPLLPTSRIGAAMGHLGLYNGSNTTQDVAIAQATSAVNEQIAKVNTFFNEDWKKYQAAVDALELQLFKAYEPLR